MATSTSIKLDDELKARIQALADAQKRTSHWIMREAIEQYVDKAEKRAAFLREAQESWVHYKETGLHITGDELSAWLKTWGTDEETSPPQCHT
ncbi:MAG: CopG family transcriptional regulator [Nitrosospira sp.]